MSKRCGWCGEVVPHHGAMMRRYVPGTNYKEWKYLPNPQAGKPRVSSAMTGIDPQGLFCTMRCAARFGVRAANGWITKKEVP